MNQFRQRFFWSKQMMQCQITDIVDQQETSESESDEECRQIFRQIHNNALHGRLQGKLDEIAANTVQKMEQTLERNMNMSVSSYETSAANTLHSSQFTVDEPHSRRSARTSTPRGKPNALRPVNGSMINASVHSSRANSQRLSASNFTISKEPSYQQITNQYIVETEEREPEPFELPANQSRRTSFAPEPLRNKSLAYFDATRYEKVPRRKSQFPVERYRTMVEDSPYCSPIVNNAGIKAKVKRRRTINATAYMNPHEYTRPTHYMSKLAIEEFPESRLSRSHQSSKDRHNALPSNSSSSDESEQHEQMVSLQRSQKRASLPKEPSVHEQSKQFDDEQEIESEQELMEHEHGNLQSEEERMESEHDLDNTLKPASSRRSSNVSSRSRKDSTLKKIEEFNEIVQQVLESSKRSIRLTEANSSGDDSFSLLDIPSHDNDAAEEAKNSSDRMPSNNSSKNVSAKSVEADVTDKSALPHISTINSSHQQSSKSVSHSSENTSKQKSSDEEASDQSGQCLGAVDEEISKDDEDIGYQKSGRSTLPPIDDTDFEAMRDAFVSGVNKTKLDSLSRIIEQNSEPILNSRRSIKTNQSHNADLNDEELANPTPFKDPIKNKNSTVNHFGEEEELPSFKDLSAIPGMTNKTLDVGNEAADSSKLDRNLSLARRSIAENDHNAQVFSEDEDNPNDRPYSPPRNSVSSGDMDQNSNGSRHNDSDDEDAEEDAFKAPKAPAPKKRANPRPTVKTMRNKMPVATTFINKTPTIIYPEAIEEDDLNVRRSNRIRVKPLDYWRNQKLKYKTDSDTKCMIIEGVEKGFVPDRGSRRAKPSKPAKRKMAKQNNAVEQFDSQDEDQEEERHPIESKKVCLFNPTADLSVHQDVNKTMIEYSEKVKRETTQFFSKNDLVWKELGKSNKVYIAVMTRYNSNGQNKNASGFVKLMSETEKPRQQSGGYFTQYMVMYGVVSVKINDNPAVLVKSMESFSIGINSFYSIRNMRKDEALLHFTMSAASSTNVSSSTASRRNSASSAAGRRVSK